ncbi:MAG: hypothetical protein ACYDH1_16915 [Anaerolineaceae bacterium]
MKKWFLLFILLLMVVSACQVTQPETKTDVLVTQVTNTPIATRTSTSIPPTSTSLPTFTSTTVILTATPTITIIPTIAVQFEKARIFGMDDHGTYSLVIFEFPKLEQAYQVKINNNLYSCSIDGSAVNKLFCTGAQLRINEYVHVEFFTEENSKEIALYQGDYFVPEPYKTPMPLGDPRTWCPLRGTDVFCETEHRVEDGEECWVQSCFDACGYYYSYHTCKYPPDNNFLSP